MNSERMTGERVKSTRITAKSDNHEDVLGDFLHGVHLLLVLCQDGHNEICSTILQMAEELQITARVLSKSELTHELDSATMGTRLYLCGDWAFVYEMKQLVHGFGITDEELLLNVRGQRRHPVLCAGCYHRNEPSERPHMECARCERKLEVSNHYSVKLDAVMGYLALPEQLVSQSQSNQTERTDKTDKEEG